MPIGGGMAEGGFGYAEATPLLNLHFVFFAVCIHAPTEEMMKVQKIEAKMETSKVGRPKRRIRINSFNRLN